VTEFRAHRHKKPLKLLSEADYASDTTDAEWPEIEPHLPRSAPREQHNVASSITSAPLGSLRVATARPIILRPA
jgi:hypothetical protein